MNSQNTFQPEPCPVCEAGTWRPHADGTYEFVYGRKRYSVSGQHYALCDRCGTRGYLPRQRDANQQLIRDHQQGLPSYISPSDVLALREKYLLTQEQAGMIFGGGKQAFSKWECGKAAPAGPTARLLKLALKSSEAMEILASDAGIRLSEPAPHNRRATDKEPAYGHQLIRGYIREEFTAILASLPTLSAAVLAGHASKTFRGSTTVFEAQTVSGAKPMLTADPPHESEYKN